MPVDPEFDELCTETVTVYDEASTDKYGKRTYSGTGTSYQCRLVYGTRMVRDMKGREVVEAGRAIIFGTAPTVTDEWRMVLPDGTNVVITSFSTINDEDGAHHTVLGFGGQ